MIFFIDFFLQWNIYVASLAEYETFFTSFVELFNRLYEKEFKKYPSYPKFSIWRLMVNFFFFNIQKFMFLNI